MTLWSIQSPAPKPIQQFNSATFRWKFANWFVENRTSWASKCPRQTLRSTTLWNTRGSRREATNTNRKTHISGGYCGSNALLARFWLQFKRCIIPPPSGGGRGRGQCPVCLSRVHVYTYVRIRWCPIKCLRRLAFRQRRATNVVERVSNPFGVPRHNAELLQVQCACVNELSRGKRAAGIEIGPYAGQRSSTRGVREPPTRTIAFCSGKFQSFEVHKRTEEASFHKPSSSRLIVEFYSHRQFYARTSSFTFCSSWQPSHDACECNVYFSIIRNFSVFQWT